MLIVEDGTGVVNANSYNSVAEYIAYAALYGYSIDNQAAEIQLRKGMDFIETKRYKGTKEFDTNSVKFPRTGIYIDNEQISSADSLSMIKRAQQEVSLSINAGNDPLATTGGRKVSSESFGPMTRSYSTSDESKAFNPRIGLFLDNLLYKSGSPYHFRVVSDIEGNYDSYGPLIGYKYYE